MGCRQVVRQRFLIPSFVGSNPATPTKTDKSLEIATFSFIYKRLQMSVCKGVKIAKFLPYTDQLYEIILCFQYRLFRELHFSPRKCQPISKGKKEAKKLSNLVKFSEVERYLFQLLLFNYFSF